MWTISNGNQLPDGRVYRKGAAIRFNEWSGWNGKPNEGLRMEVADVAKGIKAKWTALGRNPAYIIADPSIWKVDGGPSHAETMMRHGVILRKADNSRIVGYQEVRGRIAGDEEGPMLYATANCHAGFWRTMPDIVMDETHVEDIDTDSEDHCADDVRYFCMSRPWVKPLREIKERKRDWLFDRQDDEEENWRTA